MYAVYTTYVTHAIFVFITMETENYLFVYGTLLDNGNEFATYLNNNCSIYSKGKLKAKLYDLGEYPGAIATDELVYTYGTIVKLTNSKEVLKHLDDYEGYGPTQLQPNLFIRVMTEVESDSGFINCWVYFYNLSVTGLKVIESGDYLKYKF